MKRNRIRIVLEMIKFEHSVFALPFALTGAVLAARASRNGWPTLRQIAWIVVAMVAARSAAMTMNRIVDLCYDRENPRTNKRALATGDLSVPVAWVFTIVAVGLFLVAAWQLNRLALELAPVALAILFFYSFTKRFTNWSHLFLGFALGISPAAAWIAVTGGLDLRILILCAAVTLWVGGFDVLYACQDVDYDRRAGLFSVPKRRGIALFWKRKANVEIDHYGSAAQADCGKGADRRAPHRAGRYNPLSVAGFAGGWMAGESHSREAARQRNVFQCQPAHQSHQCLRGALQVVRVWARSERAGSVHVCVGRNLSARGTGRSRGGNGIPHCRRLASGLVV